VIVNDNRRLRLGANLGFNHARLTSIDAATTAAIVGRPGDRLPNSPRVTVAAWSDATVDLWGRTVEAELII
jgi:outer membrane receptor protein involved in Fe transport